MSNLVCPKCGRTSDEVKFIDAFCIYCYPVNIKVPGKVELERCTRCGNMKMRGEWTAFSEAKIKNLILDKCKGDFESAEYDMDRQVVVFRLKHTDATIEKPVALDIRKTICLQCSRISGGYFEAIIQLRGNRQKVEKSAEMLIKRAETKTFIAKTDDKEEGIDIYLGSSKVVVGLMAELGVRALITKKLIGREQGKRLYRTTFLIRFE